MENDPNKWRHSPFSWAGRPAAVGVSALRPKVTYRSHAIPIKTPMVFSAETGKPVLNSRGIVRDPDQGKPPRTTAASHPLLPKPVKEAQHPRQ